MNTYSETFKYDNWRVCTYQPANKVGSNTNMKYSNYKIHDDRIEFDFYEFYFSSLRKNSTLTIDRIKEVDLNTFPYSLEIDNGEIVFFNHDDRDRIKEFIKINKIQVSNRVDIWNLLSNDFLDTGFTTEEKQGHKKTLVENGFTENEIKKIKKRIKWTLSGTMEWQYLGHWDLLAMKQNRNPFYPYYGENFYWWTMGIALKGKDNATIDDR